MVNATVTYTFKGQMFTRCWTDDSIYTAMSNIADIKDPEQRVVSVSIMPMSDPNALATVLYGNNTVDRVE